MALDLTSDALLGRYRLVRRLGVGGMGEVWEAIDTSLQREVALKVISQVGRADDAMRERFRREALVLARLSHPNVVTIFDVGTVEDQHGDAFPFLVMERVRGHSLGDELRQGALSPQRAVALLEQVARALAAAHGAGVVHRDLKPSNVLIGADDHVTVVDFGLARLLQQEGLTALDSLTSTGVVMGSCHYMAPEQAVGGHATPASDVFACGVLLYEALAGARPFEGINPVAVLRAVAEGRHDPLQDVVSGVPPGLAAVVARCLARDQERRYEDGAALLAELSHLRRELGSAAVAATRSLVRVSVEALRQQRRRRLLRWALVIGGVAVVASLAGVLVGRFDWQPRRINPGRWELASLLQTSGWVRAPSWNPQGTLVAVERNDGIRAEILVLDVRNGGSVSVAQEQGGAILARPAFSPDGRRIAVSRIDEDEQRVLVLPATGGTPIAVVDGADHAAWLDDEHLLFSRPRKQGNDLWVRDLAGGKEEVYLAADAQRSWWAGPRRPGGGLALLGGSSDIAVRVYVQARPGETPQAWTKAEMPVGVLGWVPDGSALLVAIDDRLVLLRARGAVPLLPAVSRIDGGALAPDGTRLAWVRNEVHTDLVDFDPASGKWSCLACGIRGLGWGSVGPDGTVAYRRQLGPQRSLFVRTTEGQERRLLPPGEEGACPSFSPDGSRIAYLSPSPRGTALKVIAVGGGEPVTLADEVERSEFPSWSPDGRQLAFAAGSPVKVWEISSGGGGRTLVTPAGGDYPAWSPDGRWIAYSVWTDASDPSQGAWLAPAEGGAPRQIGREPTRLGWSPDGRTLWQVRRGGGGLELWAAHPPRWQMTRVGPLALGAPPAAHAEHLPFTVDPSTGRLVFNRRSVAGELLLFSGIDAKDW
jgi:dipeptidyl aminopeptidase/acylaminoacyl peptidase/tRNA A-37 threonylcarbamoyl transferase component Bud32